MQAPPLAIFAYRLVPVALPAHAEGVSEPSAKPVVLTCAQPTGRLHLGNYLGAVLNWGRMQDDHTCYFGIVDQHAITVPTVPADLRTHTYECLAQYLACGLDPARSQLFVQSHVTGHTELAWILGCLCPLGQLERMTQFKDKSAKQTSIRAGLLTYPILMAADILLYNASKVPVGDDQKQHLELTRDLAQKFNHTYSDTFVIPEPYIATTGARIMSLQNPEAKMSKSDPNAAATLFITDSADDIRRKIGSAVTDSGAEVRAAADKPGVTNLLQILAACSGRPAATLTQVKPPGLCAACGRDIVTAPSQGETSHDDEIRPPRAGRGCRGAGAAGDRAGAGPADVHRHRHRFVQRLHQPDIRV